MGPGIVWVNFSCKTWVYLATHGDRVGVRRRNGVCCYARCFDDQFGRTFTLDAYESKSNAWCSFVELVKNFLGNHKTENYIELVENILSSCNILGCNKSIKFHYL